MKVIVMAAVCVAVALNYFRPAVQIGATQKTLPGHRIVLVGAVFALAQLVVTGIGIGIALLIELLIAPQLQAGAVGYIAFTALLLSGIYMIRIVFSHPSYNEFAQSLPKAKYYIRTVAENIVISVAVCAALYIAYADVLAEMLIAPAASLLVTACGAAVGYWQGYRKRKWLYAVGAMILCAAAIMLVV